MNETPTIIRRGKIVYLLYKDKVIVGSTVGMGQWVTYNQYMNWNRQGITQFKEAIEKSKEDEFTTLTDQMSLAMQCNIKGTGTTKPKDIEL